MTADPVFGAGYTLHRIDLGEDREGPIIGSLVHRLPEQPDAVPILVLHGWSDYVLDRDLLEHLADLGLDVWGLDLRKHGRSLLPGQTPTEIDHLNRYDVEIDASLRIIGRHRPPIMLAHSTGGLTAALWAVRHPGTVRALALNSPWLEMHLGAAVRRVLTWPVHHLAVRLQGRSLLPHGADHYARSTHRDYGGMYEYDLAYKPPGGHPFPADTLAAVLDGQNRLEASGPLAIPVLVMHSTRSAFGVRLTETMRRADSVLDVRAIAQAARTLGPDVRIEAIDGARHDVFLSDADARHRAIAVLDDWLEGILEAPHTMG